MRGLRVVGYLVGKSSWQERRDAARPTANGSPIISIGGYYMEGKKLADYGREMEQYRAAGMAGCKFKVGGLAPEEDFKRVEVARKAAGPDFELVVDAEPRLEPAGRHPLRAVDRAARHRLVRGAMPTKVQSTWPLMARVRQAIGGSAATHFVELPES